MKKALTLTFVALLSIGSLLLYSNHKKQQTFSQLQLSNIEALVGGEENNRYKCYTRIHEDEGSAVVVCTTCNFMYGYTDDLFCYHDWCFR